MVELVDTQDLKSCGHCDRAGSTPAPGTLRIKGLLEIAVPFFIRLHWWSVPFLYYGSFHMTGSDDFSVQLKLINRNPNQAKCYKSL